MDSLVSSLPTLLFCDFSPRENEPGEGEQGAHPEMLMLWKDPDSWINEVWIAGRFLKIIFVAGKIMFS